MRNFCDTAFWDINVTWNTSNPDLTTCFQNSLLIWLPFGVLLVLLPLDLHQIAIARERPVPWGCVNISKLVLNVLLCCLFVLEGTQATYEFIKLPQTPLANLIAPVVELVTIIAVMLLADYSRPKGLRASLVLPVFWLIEAVSLLLRVRSKAMMFSVKLEEKDLLPLVIKVAISLIVIIQVILSGVVESKKSEIQDSQHSCPMTNVPFFSRVCFFWMTSTFFRGLRGELSQDCLFPLCEEMKCSTVSKVFEKASYDSRTERTVRVLQEESLDDHRRLLESTPKVRKKRNIVLVLFKIAGFYFTLGAIFELFSIALSFVAPFVLNLLLDFIATDEIYWHGFVYAAVFCLGSTCAELAAAHSLHLNNIASIQVKASLIDALYKKLFRLSGTTKREHTSGEIINLMAVDTEEIFELTENLSQLWSVPLRIVCCMYFLWIYLGPSCMVGLGIIAIMGPMSFAVAKRVNNLHDARMATKDERMKIINEILNGIKVLKLYAWEPPFIQRVQEVRNNELTYLTKLLIWDSCFILLWASAPLVVALSTFSVYLAVDKTHVLDPNTAFVSLAVLSLLRYPMGLLPDLLSRLVRARVSIKRLSKFFNSEELDPTNVGDNPELGDAVTFFDGTFSWSLDQEPALKNLTVRITEGSLVAIVGPVGAGKSSLLSAVLGEMYKLDGQVDVQGTLAYVPQVAWIQNATLQQNILLTEKLKNSVYQEVLRACALEPDLEMLPAGDQTEIGEKGINLSGGQKLRVSLARAVYQERSVYLLDDPLSAVDSHVATHLFQHVIGPMGLLKEKTRILVTHNVAILSEVDHILVIDGGCLIDQGSYDELMGRGGNFTQYIQEHLRESDTVERQTEVSDEHDQSSKHSEGGGFIEKDDEDDDLARLTEEEGMEKGKIHMKVYLEYFRTIGIPLFLCSILTSLLFSATEMGSGLWLSKWSTDRPSSSEAENIELRNMRIAVYGLLVFGHGFFIVITALILWIGGILGSRAVHDSLLHRIMRAPLYLFDTTPTGRIVNRFSKDMEDVDVQIPSNLNYWLTAAMWVPVVLCIIALNTIYMLLVFLPLGFLYYYIQKLYIRTTRQLTRMTATSRSPIYSSFSESLAGVSSIRAFRAEKYFVEQCQSRVDTYSKCYSAEMASNRWMEASLYLIGSVVVFGTALLSITGRKDDLHVGLVGLALAYCLDITEALGWLVRISAHLESSVVALERIKDYLGVPQEAEWEVSELQPPLNWPHAGEITIQDLKARYREGLEPVLKGLSIHIQSGQKVGVIGRTGAGKSSLVLSLFRIIEPLEGTIIVDGVDVGQVGLHDLRGKLTVIPQDPVIFAGTLRMNLDPWSQYSDEEVWLALEQAHLKAFVSALPETLMYSLAEGGENLSAGQRQMVCLTRALLRNTRILVLDEATASVDLDTDKLIQTTIREAFAQCTVITIAHRLHTILDYDRIVVMSNGEIIEDGQPDYLLQDTTSHFFSMARDAGLT